MRTKLQWIWVVLLMMAWTAPVALGAGTGRPVGEIVRIEGRVDLTAPDRPAVAARKGQTVRVGDILRTKSRAKAEVRFSDGSVLRMAETSRVAINRFMVSQGRTDGILHLFRGKIETLVQKSKGLFGLGKRNRFEVHTKNAVCGVRGTDYFSSYRNGASDFIFKEGTGYGFNKNDPDRVARVIAGQALRVAGVDQPPRVRPASQAEIDAHSADTVSDDPQDEGKKDGSSGDGAAPGGSNDPVAESDGTDSPGEGSGTLGGDGYFTSGEASGIYSDGAVPGPEIFSDDMFTADGDFSDAAMPMLMDVFGPDSMLTNPYLPWENETINPGLTTSMAVAGSFAGGYQLRLYGTWDPLTWEMPHTYIDMVRGQLDAVRYLFASPAGFWLDGQVTGELTGIWVGTDGSAGYLIGDLQGAYADDGTWDTGYLSMNALPLAGAGAAAFGLSQPVPDPQEIDFQYAAAIGRTFDSGTGTITILNPDDNFIGGWAGVPDQDWGMFRFEINGSFTDGVDDAWNMEMEMSTVTGGTNELRQWLAMEGSQWSGAQIHGKAAGAWVDLENALTGIMGGPLTGLFDPADPKNLWNLDAGGAWIGTERFLAMAGKGPGTADTAALDALGIPRFEVGRTDLSGTDGNLDVQINDMIFFSHASGQAPKIWASGSVTGQYSATPALGTEVLLNGSGFANVGFTVERWDGMGGKWGARVVGAGQVGGHDVAVAGGAAGEVNAPASFVGTAAGVAGPAAAPAVAE